MKNFQSGQALAKTILSNLYFHKVGAIIFKLSGNESPFLLAIGLSVEKGKTGAKKSPVLAGL